MAGSNNNPFETPADVPDEPGILTPRQVWMLIGGASVVVATGYLFLNAALAFGIDGWIAWVFPAVGLLAIATVVLQKRRRIDLLKRLVAILVLTVAGYICFVPVCTGLTLSTNSFSPYHPGYPPAADTLEVDMAVCSFFAMLISGGFVAWLAGQVKKDKQE